VRTKSKPPPWSSGNLLYHRSFKRMATFKGCGGWIRGENHDWVIVIPISGRNLEFKSMEEWWDISEVEYIGRLGTLHLVTQNDGPLH